MLKTILAGTTKLPFSHATRLGDLIFVSGQASVDLATGDIIAGTFTEEMSRSLENMRTIITTAGGRWEDIVKVNCYVRRDADLAEFNQLYRQFFSEPFPARTTITNCLPVSILFEIDCIACLRQAG
ncbi:MAG: RidA family protein [Acidobacteriota bacterium]|nr:RidA family protein [Acidobacteriota bacterium]